MWIFNKINEIAGSFTVLFLFFSGVIVAATLLFSALRSRADKRRGAQRADGDKDAVYGGESKAERRSPFGALCLALAGTLGVGNISGVAAAISVGGAGAVFWMWVSALFCSALKYAEVVLAVRFRRVTPEGGYEGGAHYYIKNGLGAGRLSVVFCLLCVFSSYTIGNITQVNAAAQSLRYAFGIKEYISGALCLLLILVFCRSGSTIYSFTLRLIPLLCLCYVALSSIVIFSNLDALGGVMRSICISAFTPRAGIGGISGIVCGRAVRIGITRGVLSNEAGCGTAPIAHASADARSASAQGRLGVIEVLFDTLFLCTLTAFVILISAVSPDGELSTVTAISAFSAELGEWVRAPLSVSMLLFAIASAVGWNYYGRVSLSYLGAGEGALLTYSLSYAVCAFFGAGISEGIIWGLSDISIYLMSFINTSAVLLLTRFWKKNENGIDIQRSR